MSWQRYKSVGIVGDLHCGSKWAIWPWPDGGDRSALSYLHRCFNDLTLKQWPELDLLILMGDLIDGTATKDAGRVVFSTSIRDQRRAAQEVLTPLVQRSKRVIRVTGTAYHDEDAATDALAVLDHALGVDETAQEHWVDMGGDRLLHAAHHPASSAANIGTAMGKEIEGAIAAASKSDVPEPTWIVRAHLHRAGVLDAEGITVIFNGCWKFQDPYALKGGVWRWRPRLGATLLAANDLHPSGYLATQTTYRSPPPRILRDVRSRRRVRDEVESEGEEAGRHMGPEIPKSKRPEVKYA